MIAEFPARQQKWRTLYYVVNWITDSTKSVERLPGSGHRSLVRTGSNIELVSDLILNQEGQPETSKSPQEIARDWNFTFLSCENCQEWFAAESVSMPWSSVPDSSSQTEMIECMQVFEETYDSEQDQSYSLVLWWKDFLLWRCLLTAKMMAYMPKWKQNVMCHQVDCFVYI